MPELPEVETVRRGLIALVGGRRIDGCLVREPRLRWPLDAKHLTRETRAHVIVGVRRRAKYLLLDLADARAASNNAMRATPNKALVVHLGMTGWMGLRAAPFLKHDHVLFRLDDGTHLCFNDARRFGSLHVVAPEDEADFVRFRHLGAEPLDATVFDGAYLHAQCKGRLVPIKERIMNAQCVVGVGNIYASEALFTAGIHPLLPAGKLSRNKANKLAAAVRVTLQDAIERGGTTLRDFMHVDGLKGMFAPRLRVYNKRGAACTRCDGTIRRVVLAGRSTFYCPRCQTR